MGLANVLCEWDYQMYLVNGTISNVPCEWNYPICPGKELANVPRELDYPMCHVNGTSQCAL